MCLFIYTYLLLRLECHIHQVHVARVALIPHRGDANLNNKNKQRALGRHGAAVRSKACNLSAMHPLHDRVNA